MYNRDMKTIVWIIILVILIGAVTVIFTGDKTPKEVIDINTSDTESLTPFMLLKNAEITVPDSDTVVTLTDGKGSFEIVPDSASLGRVTLLDDMSAQWSKEDRTDLAVILAVSTGGTGTFYYVVIFDVSDDVLTQKSEMLIGDRIKVTRVGIGELVHDPEANYRVTVKTLVREEGEPFAAEPTVPKTRTFYVTNQILEEVEVGKDDT